MINFKRSVFIKSATKQEERPNINLKEVLIVGKSNVGKSSLINALTGQNRLAFTSSKPGHTKLLNYYNIDDKFLLVDAPGYGFAKGGIDLDRLFASMMESYFKDNKFLSMVLLLLDARREFNDNDLEILNFVKSYKIPYFLIITKMDKVNQKEKAQLNKYLASINIDKSQIFFTSSVLDKTLDPFKKELQIFLERK